MNTDFKEKDIIELGVGEWEGKYRPEKNNITNRQEFNGRFFETYGEDFEYVSDQPNKKIWTLIEEDGKLYIVSGFLFVNRIGYFVAQKPYDRSKFIEVPFEE